jgi:hypothetical protein
MNQVLVDIRIRIRVREKNVKLECRYPNSAGP